MLAGFVSSAATMNPNFAWSSTASESSAQRVGWGMGPAAFCGGKKEKNWAKKEKNKAGNDTLTDGAPHPLWELAEMFISGEPWLKV